MKKILEKIYSESDEITNISLFIASIVAIIVYFKNTDIILISILFIATFSFSKVTCKIIFNIFFKKGLTKKLTSDYSKEEKSVISEFINKGGCGITFEEYKSLTLSQNGLNSLMARNIIRMIDSLPGEAPGGFYLDQNIYKAFLNK